MHVFTNPRNISDDPRERPRQQSRQETNAGDADLLDAYSRAVIGVVGKVGPAVICVEGSGARRQGGQGSGFVISSEGLALTNSHVVGGRESLTAVTEEGDRLDAEVVGDDPTTDLALLQIAATDLPVAELGDSESLQVGQLVIAMGNPLGFQSTVSTGVVSAVGRAMRGGEGRLIENVVQHTAPLNPGNSGGPLVDSHGRVVGINTAVIAMAQGLGFAVPATTAQWVASELRGHGRVRRRQLGIRAATVAIPRHLIRALDLLSDQAVEIADVAPRSPASLAGLRAGDQIVSAAGRIVTSVDDLHRILSLPGKVPTLELEVLRGAQLLEMTVPLT